MISIIIPVYNGARFVKKCYESLSGQTYKDWEAVFIDDGSNDNTVDELKLIENDSRVRIISKINEGVAVARDIGIKNARGEYLTFLDIDDTLPSNALEKFVNSLKDEDVDVVIGGINIAYPNGKIKRIFYTSRYVEVNDAVKELCDGHIKWQLCAKAFKSDLFLNVYTPAGIMNGEDMAVCIQAVSNARRVKLLPVCVYNYIQHFSSVTHSEILPRIYAALQAIKFLEEKMGHRLNVINKDCLYLLIISAGLRHKIDNRNKLVVDVLNKHLTASSLIRLPLVKAISLLVFKYFRINIFNNCFFR